MDNEIFDKIKEFVVKQRWDYDFPLTRDVSLVKGLGLRGDDAIEFIVAYGKVFNVDLTQFMATYYFEPEGDTTIDDFIDWIRGRKKEPLRPLTLGDLEKAVIAGKLDETVIGVNFT